MHSTKRGNLHWLSANTRSDRVTHGRCLAGTPFGPGGGGDSAYIQTALAVSSVNDPMQSILCTALLTQAKWGRREWMPRVLVCTRGARRPRRKENPPLAVAGAGAGGSGTYLECHVIKPGMHYTNYVPANLHTWALLYLPRCTCCVIMVSTYCQ